MPHHRIIQLTLCLALGIAPMVLHARDALEDAISAAAPGAVVQVAPGIHHVHLVVRKPLVINGAPGAVLDGDGVGDVVRIASSHVTVRNLGIRDSGRDLTAMNAGIFVVKDMQDITIADNRLTDVLFGIYLDGSNDTRVERNTVVGMTRLRVPDRGDGIHLWNDTGCVVDHNQVSGSRDGIYVYVSPNNRITDNVMHDVRYGVHYMYSKDNVLRGNLSYRNVGGFALMSSDHLEVAGNVARDDVSYGMLMNYVTYSDIAGNDVKRITGEFDDGGNLIPGAEGKGFFVYLDEFNTIRRNRVADSNIGIHMTAGSDYNRVYGNTFTHNRTQVMYVQNLGQEWSWRGRGNYWSNYLGWDLKGGGVGDVPYRPNDAVDVLLWKYPSTRMLMSSPSILLLRYVQRAFPVFTPVGIQDSHPLMEPPAWQAGVAHG